MTGSGGDVRVFAHELLIHTEMRCVSGLMVAVLVGVVLGVGLGVVLLLSVMVCQRR